MSGTTDDIARQLVDALYAGTPVPAGCRVNHARGILVEGLFRPSSLARELSSAATFAGADQRVIARFSSSSGNEEIADDDPHANPRGLAVRIGAAPGLTLVGHSIEGFPARDPLEFLSFIVGLNARATDPSVREGRQGNNAATRRFEAMLSGTPTSVVALSFHMLHPFRLTSRHGDSIVGRLSIAGVTGGADPAAGSFSGRNYLERELQGRLSHGLIKLPIVFQPITPGDVAEDLSAPWRHSDNEVVLGQLMMERIAADQTVQRDLVFDPAELPPGVAFAGDPMIETRIAAYRLAARRRRGDAS